MSQWSFPITPGSINQRCFLRVLGSLCAVVLSLISASTRAEAPASSLQETLQHPIIGERLEFSGRWYGIPVGNGSIEVLGRTNVRGRDAYHIRLEGHSNAFLSRFYPIHDELDTFIDAETLLPLESRKHQREGHYRSQETVIFDLAARTATYQSHLNDSVKEVALPEAFQDILGALYWLRSQPLEPETAVSLNMYTDEKIYETQINIHEPEPLELLKRGTFNAFMVEPDARFKGILVRRGKIWAYFSADAKRLPLLIRVSTPWGVMSAILDETSIPEVLQRP